MSKKILLIAALILVIGGITAYFLTGAIKNIRPPRAGNSVQYTNAQYGFVFSLPQDWKGYSIILDSWEGLVSGPKGDVPSVYGPLINIRNPRWTAQKPYQDIPIMVFTLSQWDSLLREEFHIGAAPIGPSRIGYNNTYVFALPARYNYAFPAGYEEVDKIMQGNPLQTLSTWGNVTSDEKILLCGGIPNGSTQKITETTRLFINLPKDIFSDKDHNLQFKTVSGNATAGWISNAGAYGEAYQSTSECWSYYYEFDGKGEIDASAKAAIKDAADYNVHFIVNPTK